MRDDESRTVWTSLPISTYYKTGECVYYCSTNYKAVRVGGD